MPFPLREFLGWDRPCLPQAADWLLARYATPRGANLAELTIVLPGRRAGRRLVEILAQRVQREWAAPFAPPRVITPGELPERLFTPPQPLADDLLVEWAWVDALRATPADEIAGLTHTPPEARDLLGWIMLARQLGDLRRTLAGDGIELAQVPEKFPALLDIEASRWEIIARVHGRVLERLAGARRLEPDAARLAAVADRACHAGADVVLIAAADLNGLTRAMLAQVAARVAVLVHAPGDRAEDFDEWGCVIPARWADRPLELNRRHVRVVDRLIDQACAVLEELARAGAAGDGESLAQRYSAGQITIGLGDDRSAGLIERTLELAGVAARAPQRGPVIRSAPALVLAALAAFIESRRFDDLAALLRHADLADHLRAALSAAPGADAATEAIDDWVSLLDRYASDHLQRRLSGQWLGEAARAARLKAVHDAVLALAPADHADDQPLPHWSEAIASVLARVYPGRLDPAAPDQQPTVAALTAIGERLRQQAALDPRSALTPRVTFAQAIALALDGLADAMIPQEPAHDAVELLNWLELPLDEAPALLITSVNEGMIPARFAGDAFLPQSLRGALGMEDAARRYARDRMMLEAILSSRPHVRLIVGRRGSDDEPLAPSRLLLACPDQELPTRLIEFYDKPATIAALTLLLQPAAASRLRIPRPVPPAPPVTSLSVTAFRDYLACPYRFYLKHVRRLQPLHDHEIELNARAFGDLAHLALEALAEDRLAQSDDPDAVAGFLHGQLDRLIRQAHGQDPPAVVRIQGEQLRARLDAAARWHARQVAAGWRIRARCGEIALAAVHTVDGQPFTIRGRIDRIDQHPDHGFQVMDYKTSDRGVKPDQTHRSAGAWIDLQLPLYRLLARSAGCDGVIRLGYVVLPKKTAETGFLEAPWNEEEIGQAIAVAEDVIRKVRSGVFWPPRYPVEQFDEYARICMDEVADRGPGLGDDAAAGGGA